ncbi:MAG: SCO family protein [Kofleriaceae bacterium]|nr:SCO family protein [Kofleriaceae bacterium]MCB9565608.1 SCO family protein [Kofleriaceae bacterium]MCB9575391.1 SCO family protein [Kofleriaceae bacterium]
MAPSGRHLRALAVGLALLGAVAIAPAAARGDDVVTPAPARVDAIRLDEKLGAQVPLDLRFRDQDGHDVTLRDLVRGDLPVLLTFNYSNCPMLCSLQLNALVSALPQLPLTPGQQFRMVTVIIEPKETPAGAAETRGHYLDKLGDHDAKLRATTAAGGWTFLVAATDGDQTAIRELADTVGFHFEYVPERAEWAHPAALIFLSPSGVVTRYLLGIDYPPGDVTTSLLRAGTAEPSASVGFLQRCFHYDPAKNSHARMGVRLMKYGAAVFVTLLLGVLTLAHYLRRRRGAGSPTHGVGR